jgi:rhodanese-related sulfurtransferase
MKTSTLHIAFLFTLITGGLSWSQSSIKEVLTKYNKGNIPYMSVASLNEKVNEVTILDARELNEFKVSHLKNSIFVGYKNFHINEVIKQLPNKSEQIVVYCSVGVRSEEIANKLKIAGYTNVQNLYGGIFEWKNNDYPVYNANNIETDSVHAYSKQWRKYLLKGIKVY